MHSMPRVSGRLQPCRKETDEGTREAEGGSMTVVKPKPSHPWNSHISIETCIARIRGEIEKLREEIKAKQAEIRELQARRMRK
jgi:hypothetical protein